MSTIVIDGLRKSYSSTVVALDGIDIEIESGELLVLLGPSGCGKTTLLRSVAGLESPDSGSIRIGDTTVFDSTRRTDMRSERRDVGMVFQNYALWPHMTVRKNINYPLKARGMVDERRGGAVERVAELVGCGALLDRYPAQLSGGQQQRVALARALVAEPAVILFDEPLSNLDAKLRRDLRTEIRRLHQRVGFTGIYVTHDQSEALAIGDRIALLAGGRLIQVDEPTGVYRRPQSEWAADFMGLTNRIELELKAGVWTFEGHPALGVEGVTGTQRTLRLRPSGCRIVAAGTPAPDASIVLRGGSIDLATFAGEWMETEVRFGSHLLHVQEPSQLIDHESVNRTAGAAVDVVVDRSALIDFGAGDEGSTAPEGR